MSIVVWNPTNEVMVAQYVGEHTEIKPDSKLKMDDARAKHVLNELGPRGLCRLEYGDDEKKIGEAGRKRHEDFMRKQVMNYNQLNEGRRQQNMPYIEPPDLIKEYSKILGIGIIEPYNIKDTEREELASLRKMVADQSKQNEDLMATINRLLEAKESGETIDPTTETAEEKAIGKNRLEYNRLHKGTFKGWIKNNKERIGAWPEENLTEIRTKYSDFYNKELEI